VVGVVKKALNGGGGGKIPMGGKRPKGRAIGWKM